MKKQTYLVLAILIVILLSISLSSCEKKTVTPPPLTVQVYEYQILYYNSKEPSLMRTFIVEFENRFYYASNTDFTRDLESLTWEQSKEFPRLLYFHTGKRIYPDLEIRYSFIQSLK